ncbi:putative C6 transcription factor [Ilyonectria destructans]|nr:putative C6 transcription factor [Ilyonectria destructans]
MLRADMHGRPHKRLHQACEDCRRKKTRCPGERPACSSCVRLSKTCKYPDIRGEALASKAQHGGSSIDTERRLAQLEARIRMMERRDPSSDTESPTTRRSANSRASQDWQLPLSPRTEIGDTSTVSLLPPRDTLEDVVDSYFQYHHKQPLWLFEREEFSSIEDCREETLLSLLSLSSCHSNHPFFQGRLDELSQTYAQAARERIMQRVGEGNVSLSTIQNLCILALANIQANNPTLVCLHVGMAATLAKCANLDFETCSLTDFGLRAESRRKVFWSLHLLQQMYGHQAFSTDILQDVSRPQYVATHAEARKTLSDLPPAIPHEEISTQTGGMASPEKKHGTWVYMIQLSTLWGEVRTYVKQWAQQTSSAPPPWSIESGYAVIGAHLMDLETKLPACHRFDLARFPDQDHQHLQDNRGYWSPWLYLQFTYHTIHNMLNHPFLYSSRPQQSTQLGVPNTFWKTSSELAFIHSTWVARLVDMVTSKAFRVSDPFIGHCTAIAATVQIYFCRAADKTTREAALDRFARCVAFLAELALLWPSCRWLHERLQALVRSAFAVDHPQGKEEESSAPRTILINTRLMWDILLYNFAAYRGTATLPQMEGLFDGSSFFPEDNIDGGEDVVEMDNFHNPTVEVILSNGQALPPQSGQRRNRAGQDNQGPQAMQSPAPASPMPGLDANFTEPAPPASLPMSLEMAYDPFFQFQDLGSPFLGTWEVGNL